MWSPAAHLSNQPGLLKLAPPNNCVHRGEHLPCASPPRGPAPVRLGAEMKRVSSGLCTSVGSAERLHVPPVSPSPVLHRAAAPLCHCRIMSPSAPQAHRPTEFRRGNRWLVFPLSLSPRSVWRGCGGGCRREGTKKEILHGSLLPPRMYSRVERALLRV